MAETMTTALELIAAERERQRIAEGWTPEHDDSHERGDLARAAACYALPERHRNRAMLESDEPAVWHSLVHRVWPWDARWWKPTPDDRVRELVKAGALIVAEIERLQRAESARG